MVGCYEYYNTWAEKLSIRNITECSRVNNDRLKWTIQEANNEEEAIKLSLDRLKSSLENRKDNYVGNPEHLKFVGIYNFKNYPKSI